MKRVLGILASPRRGSNSKILLKHFLQEAPSDSETVLINVFERQIHPCNACGYCEGEGECVIRDDMDEVYSLVEEADAIIVASPIYFYGPPAPLKVLIDRCQVFWARRYLFGEDLKSKKGVLINVGARERGNVFIPSFYIVKVWFDSINAELSLHLKFGGFDGEREVEKEEIIHKVRDYGRAFFAQI